jgi:hypothetical protein
VLRNERSIAFSSEMSPSEGGINLGNDTGIELRCVHDRILCGRVDVRGRLQVLGDSHSHERRSPLPAAHPQSTRFAHA